MIGAIKTTSILGMLLTTSILSVSSANASVLDALKLKKKVENTATRDVYSGVNFHYLDQEDRILIIENFLKSVELEYAPLQLKEKRLGISLKDIKRLAISRELGIADLSISSADRKDQEKRDRYSFLQAKSNMEFFDRMDEVVASFKDTHFSIYATIPRPAIYNGLRLNRIEGKVVVGAIDTKLLSYVEKLSRDSVSGINVGDQIVEIDDEDVEVKVNGLKKFISSSTDSYLDLEAVYALTIRNYNYPSKSFMKVKFSNGATYKLPYFALSSLDSTPRIDALTYLKKIGINTNVETQGLSFNKETNKWEESGASFKGYSVSQLSKNLKGVIEYSDDYDSVGMRTGYLVQKGKTYAVMQLLTFYTKNLNTQDEKLTFMNAIRRFAIDAKENGLPVILDIRYNGGGNAAFPAQLLSVFTEKEAEYAAPSRGMRITPYARNINEPMFYQYIQGENQSYGITWDDLRNLLEDGIAERKVYPPMYNVTGVITADQAVGGFENKMVVLVDSRCISACDMTAALFKASKRATIIGTQSNGTGAGYTSTSQLNTEWTDQLRTLKTNIPNFLFGFPHENKEALIYEEGSVERLCSENIPTYADVKYETTKEDLTSHNKGWLTFAAGILDQK